MIFFKKNIYETVESENPTCLIAEQSETFRFETRTYTTEKQTIVR